MRDVTRDALGRAADGRDVRLADLWPNPEEIDAPSGALFAWERLRPISAGRPSRALTRASASAAMKPIPSSSSATTSPRPLLPGRADPALGRSGGLSHRARREGRRSQRLLLAPRRLGGDAARPVHQPRRKNLVGENIPPKETLVAGTAERPPRWKAAARYAESGRSVVLVAGERYGMGSSHDWAA